MVKTGKIAFEEHFMAPGFEKHSLNFIRHLSAETAATLNRRLNDFHHERIDEMDRGGISYAILSLTGPGVQGEDGSPTQAAERANDFLARQIESRPDRLGGFAALPMQDPKAAIAELERCVRQLGFKGCLVNGHTAGVYYDDVKYDVFWEALQALDVPFYLHPANAYRNPYVLEGHPELFAASWGWGVETGSHALRLLFGGVFDRFPRIKVILGHMGEGLPFLRWRFDSRFAAYPMGVSLKRTPSEYFGSNILITTSGVCSHPALIGAIGEMGAEAVMFSVDYPYENTKTAADFIETAPIDAATRDLVCRGNAARLFKLSMGS
ncbi:amidohydrolase family protein [Dongia sp.]|uniref:amidohydrolase family protein n=1 Tax=Dongia sp. TaxID=1977262 RepID=UPI003751E7E6